jgi:DHA1 family multidrug resistance protein-like MFS transporter
MNTIEREPKPDTPEAAHVQPLWKKPQVLRLLIIALCAEIGYAVLNISTMPVYLVETRQLGEASVGLVLTAFLLSEAIFKSPMGHLADKYGRKRLMTLGPALTICTSVATFVVPFEPHWLEVLAFILLRVLDGIGAAMLWPGAFASMGDAVEDNERQVAMSLLNVCYLLGVALALPLGGVVNDIGHHWPARSLFLATILFAAVVYTARRFLPEDTKQRSSGKVEGEAGLKEVFQSAREIPQYLILAIVTFAGIGFPMAIIKIFSYEEFRMSESAFGFLVLPAALSMAIFSVPMSKYGERLGRYKAVHLGMGLCSAGLCVIALGGFSHIFRTPLVMALGGLPVGFGFLLAIPAWMASVSDANCEKRAANLGAVMAAQGVGAIVGAPIGAFLYEQWHHFSPIHPRLVHFWRYSPFIGCAFCVTAGWLVGMKILHEKAPTPPPMDESTD